MIRSMSLLVKKRRSGLSRFVLWICSLVLAMLSGTRTTFLTGTGSAEPVTDKKRYGWATSIATALLGVAKIVFSAGTVFILKAGSWIGHQIRLMATKALRQVVGAGVVAWQSRQTVFAAIKGRCQQLWRVGQSATAAVTTRMKAQLDTTPPEGPPTDRPTWGGFAIRRWRFRHLA